MTHLKDAINRALHMRRDAKLTEPKVIQMGMNTHEALMRECYTTPAMNGVYFKFQGMDIEIDNTIPFLEVRFK